MSEAIIKKVAEKGCEAGAIFCKPNEFNLDHHIWVRFLVLMAQLEQNIISIQEVLESPHFESPLEQQLKLSTDPLLRYPYCKEATWVENATPRIAALLALVKDWNIPPRDKENKPCFFRKDAPLPKPILRVTPEV